MRGRRVDVSRIKAGTRLRPVRKRGGYSGWYPYITVLGKGLDFEEDSLLHVKFSNGRESKGFNINCGMPFEIMRPIQMENK